MPQVILQTKETSYIPVNFQKSKGQPGGHLKPHDTRSTRLQETITNE